MTHSNRILGLGKSAVALGLAMTAGLALFTTQAHAAPPVKGLTVGLERTFGFVAASRNFDTGPADTTQRSAGFSLGLAGTFDELPLYNRPRLAVDYIMDNAITFGGALGFAYGSFSIETEVGNNSNTFNRPDSMMFTFAPRGGYLIGLNEHFGIWPRAGFTFVGISEEPNSGDDTGGHNFALSADVPFLYSLGPMGAFLAPSLDLGIGGSVDTGDDEFDSTATEFGITFGFFGVF